MIIKVNEKALQQITGVLNVFPISEIKKVEAIIQILNDCEREETESDSETEAKTIAEN